MKMYKGTLESTNGKALKHHSGSDKVKGIFSRVPSPGNLFLFHTEGDDPNEMGVYISVLNSEVTDNTVIFTNTIKREFKLTIDGEV
jgi:hypothetical protein